LRGFTVLQDLRIYSALTAAYDIESCIGGLLFQWVAGKTQF